MKNFEKKLVKLESEESEVLRARRKMALATGHFYNELIDACLESQSQEERERKIFELIEKLPPPMRKLYQNGILTLKAELEKNYHLLNQHRGKEVEYLIASLLRDKGLDPITGGQILQEIINLKKRGQIEYLEPSPGFPIVKVPRDFFKLLIKLKIIPEETLGVTSFHPFPHEPSFILVVFREEMEKTLRHEAHHLIWFFLERGGYTRKSKEMDDKERMAFWRFKNEFMGYLIGREDIRKIGVEEILIGPIDKEILEKVIDAKNFAEVCMEIAKKRGFDLQGFIYPAMVARSFSEFEEICSQLAPIENPDSEILALLFSLWQENFFLGPKIRELLEMRKIKIHPRTLEEYSLSFLMSLPISNLSQLFWNVKKIGDFALLLGTQTNLRNLMEKIAHKRLPLPQETIRTILNLPDELFFAIPLDSSSLEDFLFSFILNILWEVDEGDLNYYRQIIDSSPALREKFNQILNRAIDAASTDVERWSSGKRKDQFERKVELLRKL